MMARLRGLASGLFWRSLPTIALLGLGGLALVERLRTAWRRRTGARPRLIWGPIPIISLKYWSLAMRERGYESTTCVSTVYAINRRSDFDVHLDEFLGQGRLSTLIRPYAMFAWALHRGDVFLRFLNGGFLRYTPLEWRECGLLKLGGKKVIVSPYGSDIAVAGHMGEVEEALFADYPALAENAEMIKRRVLHSLRCADVSIRNHQQGFLPRYDVVWPNQFALDTELWRPSGEDSGNDGRSGVVTVFHAPNHRRIKGTRHFERAVRELRADGLKVELRLLEGRPNEEIRAAMASSDIVADQLLLEGYAMFAIEAMALGKPVIANLSGLPDELREREALRNCPVVDSDPSRVMETLRRLITEPALRQELGRAGREFVLSRHSYSAIADEWEAILSHVWREAPLPARLLPARETPPRAAA